MPRAHRLTAEGGIFHLTHRCHHRAFLLKFARDRQAYRARMRAKLREFEIWLLDYCLTCNHVHLLVEAEDKLQISGFMRREELKREACWTESLAVGSAGFVERIRPLILNRRETEIVEEQPGLWVLKEAEVPYGSGSASKRGAKA